MNLSTKLIEQLEFDSKVKFKLCDKKKMQKSIREFFCLIHRDAVEKTVIAKNRKEFVFPQFYDK